MALKVRPVGYKKHEEKENQQFNSDESQITKSKYLSGTSETTGEYYQRFIDNIAKDPVAFAQYLNSSNMATHPVSSYKDVGTGVIPVAVTEQAAIKRALSSEGRFDSPEVVESGMYNLLSDDYLRKELGLAQKRVADSKMADEENATILDQWKNGGEAEYWKYQGDASSFRNWLAVGQMEGRNYDDPTDEDMLYWKNLVSGTNYKNVMELTAAEGEDAWDNMVDLWFEADWSNPQMPKYTGMANPEGYVSQTSKLEKTLSDMEDELTRRDAIKKYESMAESLPNFSELSMYTGPEKVDNGFSFSKIGQTKENFADPYYIVNRGFDLSDAGYTALGMNFGAIKQAYEGYGNLTAYEKSVYNALYNSGMKGEAQAYLDALSPDLLSRVSESQDILFSTLATDEKTALPMAAASVALGHTAAAFSPFQLIVDTFGDPRGKNDPMYTLNRAEESIQRAQNDWLAENGPFNEVENFLGTGKNPGQLLYSAGTSALDSALKNATGAVGSTIFSVGQGVSGTSYQNADEDMTGGERFVRNNVSGLINGLIEQIGIDAFFGNGAKSAKQFIAKNIAAETAEELTQYGAEELADVAIDYVFDHEHEYKSAEEVARDIANIVTVTPLSTGLSTGGKAMQISSGNRKTGKSVRSNDALGQVLDVAQSMDKNSESYSAGQKIKERMDAGKKVSMGSIGALVSTMNEELGADYGRVISDAASGVVVDRMVELGDDEQDARAAVGAVMKVAAGEQLTAEERRAIMNSKTALQVTEELAGGMNADTDLRPAVMLSQAEAKAAQDKKLQTLDEAVHGKKSTTATAAEATAEKLTAGKKGKDTDDRVTVESDGEDVSGKVVGFVDNEDGGIELKVKANDGSEKVVPFEAVKSANGKGVATIMAMGTDEGSTMTAQQATEMLATYEAVGGDAAVFATEYKAAFDAGYYGESTPAAKSLSAETVNLAYESGKRYQAEGEGRRLAYVNDAAKTAGTSQAASKGTVTFLGQVSDNAAVTGTGTDAALKARVRTMTDSQKSVVQGLKAISKATGVNMVLFESTAEGRAAGIQNGSFARGTNTIYLDLNAGISTESGMAAAKKAGTLGYAVLRTAAHELTHFIENNSKEGYAALMEAAKSEFSRKGKDWSSMVDQKAKDYAKTGEKLDRKGAEAEVLADACEMMLQDASAIERLAKKNPDLKEKIAGFIRNFLNRIRNALRNIGAGSKEARALMEMRDGMLQYSEELSRLWGVALEEAVDNTTVEQPADAENDAQMSARDMEQESLSGHPVSEALSVAENVKDENGDPLYSLRSMTEDYDTYRSMLSKWGKMSDKEITELFDTIDSVMDVVAQHRDFLDHSANVGRDQRSFHPVKKNSDPLYKVSVDFSTLCRKRLLQQAVQERLETELGKVLTKAERIAIRNELQQLKDEGLEIEVACGLCYVEAARLKSPAQIQRFFDDKRAVFVDYFAKKNKEYKKAIDKRAADVAVELGYKRDTPKKSMKKADADTITEAKREMYRKYQPTSSEEKVIEHALSLPDSEYKTAEGLWRLRNSKDTSVIFDAYTSFVRNATKSKAIENNEAWWAGDSKKISNALLKRMNAENGLRSQSWSDFQTIHMLDYMSAIMELATRGAKIQTYTKVVDFVNLMGDTGAMINLSLIPDGYDGTLSFDPVEGMDFKTALKLRDDFPDTVGTICIGISKAHIIALMASDDIDYIIPYHSSNLDKVSQVQMGLKAWDDFQDYQNETHKDYPSTNKNGEKYHKAPSFSEWFDYKAVSEYAKKHGAKAAMKIAADKYIAMCHERGLQEKFADFAAEDNYWKLLIDRKMINHKTGEIIEQKAVKPVFNKKRLLGILDGEIKRHKKEKADFDKAVETIVERWKDGDIKRAAQSKEVLDAVKQYSDTAVINAISGTAATAKSSQQSIRASDDAYMSAVENGDMDTAQRMVDEAARAAGYEPLKLYHGTRNFGFTRFDTEKSDDKISLFVTDNRRIAESYSREGAGSNLKDSVKADRYDFMQQSSKDLEPYVQKHVDKNLRAPTPQEIREHTDRESAFILSSMDWLTDYFATNEKNMNRETRQALSIIMYYGGKLAAIPTAEMEDETDGYALRMKYEDAVSDLMWENREVFDEISPVIGRAVYESANKLISARFSDPFYDENIGAFIDKWNVTDRLGDKLFSGIYELYGDQSNLLEIDAKDSNWNTIDGGLIERPGVWVTTREVAEYAKQHGYSGVRINNVRDGGGMTAYQGASNVFIYFDNTSLKSADPVTYDDEGNVIPLSERFTRSETDIRYSLRIADEVSTREYLADADPSIAETPEQANALTIYKQRIKAYGDAVEAVEKAKAELASTTDREEAIKARNRIEILQKQQSRAYDQLIAAEETRHIRELTGKTSEFIQQNLAGRTEAEIAGMIEEAESEISSLTEQLEGVKGASRQQTEATKEQIRMLKAKVTRLRNSATRNLLKTRQHYQEMFQRNRDRAEVNEQANKAAKHIKAVVKRLNDRIVHETDYKNVKEQMKPAVYELVRTFIDGFGTMVFDQKQADRLKMVYDALAKTDGDESAFYTEDVSEMIAELSQLARDEEARKKAPVGALSLMDSSKLKLEIYTRVSEIADSIWHMVQSADEIFVDGRKTKFTAIGDAAGETLLTKKDYKQLYGKKGWIQEKLFEDLLRRGNMIPTYFFESLKNGEMKTLFDGIMHGQTGYAHAILNGQKAMQAAKKRHGYARWQDQKPMHFTTKQGHSFDLTVEQMMWVYATAKREASNEIADTHHLEIGGFRFEGEQRMSEKGKGRNLRSTNKPHLLNADDVKKITDALTDQQKAYADEMVEYLSTDMAELGNQTSLELYGIRKYTEKYYFPFKTASEQRRQTSTSGSLSTTDDARLKHASYTHRLTKGANTTLVMGDFSNVVADHINRMSTYASFVSPIEAMNRVLNYKVTEDDGTVTTIRALIDRKHGTSALNYVETFLKDMNGGIQTDSRATGFLNKAISAFKRGAVGASISVAVQQPSAYVKAFSMISPKYFAHATGVGHKAAWEEAKKHSGTAVIKDMGRFDVGMGQNATEWIANTDSSDLTIWERTKGYLPNVTGWNDFTSSWKNVKEKWDGLMSALPGTMDEITWTHIWKAVKAEQADMHPHMDTSSDAFLDMCGKRFDDVVNHTQVYDSVLAKSNLMRSSNPLHKMATAFMAEPTLTANMLYSAARGDHTPSERGRIVASAALANILAAAFAAGVSAWGEEDDERPALEKYLDKFSALAIDNLNPAGWLPYISDISSMLEGYEVERVDMSVINDMINYSQKFFAKLDQGEKLTWKDYENFVGTWANLTGLSLKNVSRDARRAWNAINTKWGDPDASNIKYSVLENIPYNLYDESNTAYYDRYAAALVSGNRQKAYDIRDYLLTSKGVSEENLKTKTKASIGELYKEGKIDDAEAKRILKDNGLAKDDKEAYQTVDKWKEGGDSYSVYNTMKEAFAADDEMAIKEAIAELKDNGYTGEEISSYIKNQKVIRSLVEEGKISADRATYLLRTYAPYANDKDNVNKPMEWAKTSN